MKIAGITFHPDGNVQVDAPPPCPKCGGSQSYDTLDIYGPVARWTLRCDVCGHRQDYQHDPTADR